VFCVSPFPERGLDEAFGFSIGARRVRSCAAMLELHLVAHGAEPVRTVSAAVIGEQGADLYVALSEEGGCCAAGGPFIERFLLDEWDCRIFGVGFASCTVV